MHRPHELLILAPTQERVAAKRIGVQLVPFCRCQNRSRSDSVRSGGMTAAVCLLDGFLRIEIPTSDNFSYFVSFCLLWPSLYGSSCSACRQSARNSWHASPLSPCAAGSGMRQRQGCFCSGIRMGGNRVEL